MVRGLEAWGGLKSHQLPVKPHQGLPAGASGPIIAWEPKAAPAARASSAAMKIHVEGDVKAV